MAVQVIDVARHPVLVRAREVVRSAIPGGNNSRNGTRSKTVLTEVGTVEIDVPRGRAKQLRGGRGFSRLAKKADLAHMLRHAAASLLSAAGVPIEDIADTLGHLSIAATAEIYRHPIAPIRSGHVTAKNQLITPARAESEEAGDTPGDRGPLTSGFHGGA